jgi:hypothetical protein
LLDQHQYLFSPDELVRLADILKLDLRAARHSCVECPEDPDAPLTRAVAPEGDDQALTVGLPAHVTL